MTRIQTNMRIESQRLTDRQIDRQANEWTGRPTDRQTDKQTDRFKDWQEDQLRRLIDSTINRPTDKHDSQQLIKHCN